MATKRRQTGFSLLELMVAMLLVSIIAAVGAPSISNFTKNSALRGAATELQGIMQLARTEAIKRNQVVNLQRVGGATGDWGKTILLCEAVSNTDVCVADPIAKYDLSGLDVDIKSDADTLVSFNANGRLDQSGDPEVLITFCDNRVVNPPASTTFIKLAIAVTGRPTVSRFAADGGDVCL
jgi:type IV fimbrial biogenesis protein FimT